MSNIITAPIVLAVNSCNQGIGYRTVRHAIKAMSGGLRRSAPARAYVFDPCMGGEEDRLDAVDLVGWDEWIKLPVRDCDLAIHTARGQIRAPLVIFEPDFSRMPTSAPRLTRRAILERDGFRDQYTGEQLAIEDLTVDHVIPRARGGKNGWENLVACAKDRNHRKGNRLNEEVDLKLIRRPVAPPRLPVCALLRRSRARHPAHRPFLMAA